MGNIDKIISAFSSIKSGMKIGDFIEMAGAPDDFKDDGENGYYVWDSPVWKGVLRGGNVHRKITIQTQKGIIVSWSTDNLNRSCW